MPATVKTANCPRCGRPVRLRRDGRVGRHWDSERKIRNRCPEGEFGRAPASPRRRVAVTVDVLIPAGMGASEYRMQAGAVLREHALDKDFFVIDLNVEEAS